MDQRKVNVNNNTDAIVDLDYPVTKIVKNGKEIELTDDELSFIYHTIEHCRMNNPLEND